MFTFDPNRLDWKFVENFILSKKFWDNLSRYYILQKDIGIPLISVSDPDPDPDPPGSACFWPVRIRIRIRRKCGSGSGSGSWLKMPISLTILQVFCLVDFSFFKFILKNAHFLNILVNFWVLWKNVENFHIPEFFFENFTLTIFINALDPDPDPDPDPGSGSGSASEF